VLEEELTNLLLAKDRERPGQTLLLDPPEDNEQRGL
jgi:hypothetical protein